MHSCERVFGNVDLLTPILKYLDIEDQLRFARVNEQCRAAYQHFSRHVNYSTLYIFCRATTDQTKFVVAGDGGQTGKSLPDEGVLEDFMALYGSRVCDLLLYRVPDSLCPFIVRKAFLLRSLTTYGVEFTSEISESLPMKLQELNILDCFSGSYRIVDKLRKRMTNLQKLQIVDSRYQYSSQSTNSIKLDFPKLEFLKLNASRQLINVRLPSGGILKHLDMRLENEQLLQGHPVQYLKVLRLQLYECTNQLFSILTKSCINLETLTLEDIKFDIKTTFSLPPKVTELSFLGCNGLTHLCLKRILTDFHIVKFCSRDTNYYGDFQDFQISARIQSLEIDIGEMTKFRTAFDNNQQLKELIWKVQPNINSNLNLLRDYATYDGTCLKRVPQLQRLEIPYVPTGDTLAQLQTLQTLTLNLTSGLSEGSHLVDIIKHATFNELCLVYRKTDCKIYLDHLQEMPEAPAMVFDTSITRLTIDPYIFRRWMKSWLQLFSTNMQMKLVCWPISTGLLKFAEDMVKHSNFPVTLKTIQVCCFPIDCKELRRNLGAVVLKYTYDISLLNQLWRMQTISDKVKMAKCGCIVLSWKRECL